MQRKSSGSLAARCRTRSNSSSLARRSRELRLVPNLLNAPPRHLTEQDVPRRSQSTSERETDRFGAPFAQGLKMKGVAKSPSSVRTLTVILPGMPEALRTKDYCSSDQARPEQALNPTTSMVDSRGAVSDGFTPLKTS